MSSTKYQKGFIPIVIIVVIALAAAGGATYYSKSKGAKKANLEAEGSITASTSVNTNANSNSRASLRSLLALGGDRKCTITGTNQDGAMSGTVYFSGSSMRGDFTSTVAGMGAVESHMIRNQNDFYVWSGSQGTKMNMSIMGSTQSSTQGSSQIGLDEAVGYECTSWSKDVSVFTAPSSVNFVDMSAMMQGQMKVPTGANVDVRVNGSVNAE